MCLSACLCSRVCVPVSVRVSVLASDFQIVSFVRPILVVERVISAESVLSTPEPRACLSDTQAALDISTDLGAAIRPG